MIEWTGGRRLKTENTDFKNSNPATKRNLQLEPDKEAGSIKIIGYGKVVALSFVTNHVNVVFGVQIDKEPKDWLYNPHCLEVAKWNPTKPKAPITVESKKKLHTINCFLPLIFRRHFQLWFLYETFQQKPQKNVYADWIHVLYQTPI